MHGRDPDINDFRNTVKAVLSDEIMRFLREHEHDKAVLSAAKEVERGIRDRYDATIAATENSEAQELLRHQREEVEFGEKVLRHIAKAKGSEATPSMP